MKTLILISFLIIGAFVLAGVGTTGMVPYESANLYGALYDAQGNFLFSRGYSWWVLPFGDEAKIAPNSQVLVLDMAGVVIGSGTVKDSLYDLEMSNYRQSFMVFVGSYDPSLSVRSQVEMGRLFYCTSYDGRLIHLRNGRMYLDVFCDALLNKATADFGVVRY